MLQEYPFAKTNKHVKLIALIEFILIIAAIQLAVLLLTVHTPASGGLQFRIIAHSNSKADQQVKERVQQQIAPILQTAAAHKETAGESLQAAMPEIMENAEKYAGGMPVSLQYGEALIPPKRIGFAFQPQAYAEAYVLTIGSGRGDNWWCALFSNVCFPEQAAVVETEEEPVTFFLWEWIKSLFK